MNERPASIGLNRSTASNLYTFSHSSPARPERVHPSLTSAVSGSASDIACGAERVLQEEVQKIEPPQGGDPTMTDTLSIFLAEKPVGNTDECVPRSASLNSHPFWRHSPPLKRVLCAAREHISRLPVA
jgi:hypothetical protein